MEWGIFFSPHFVDKGIEAQGVDEVPQVTLTASEW